MGLNGIDTTAEESHWSPTELLTHDIRSISGHLTHRTNDIQYGRAAVPRYRPHPTEDHPTKFSICSILTRMKGQNLRENKAGGRGVKVWGGMTENDIHQWSCRHSWSIIQEGKVALYSLLFYFSQKAQKNHSQSLQACKLLIVIKWTKGLLLEDVDSFNNIQNRYLQNYAVYTNYINMFHF